MATTDKQLELTNLLDRASKAYYIDNSPIMTDVEFDMKFKELQKMEKESKIIFSNSPTQRVGLDIQPEFKKVRHIEPMLTIENTYDDDGLKEWLDSMIEKYGDTIFEISTKYDGVSLELTYKNGILVSASTRGDKIIGDDVTLNAKTIKSIPLTLPYMDEDGLLADCTVCVRGEVMMQRSVLEALNEQLISEGKEPKANCRNAASGSLKQLNPNITAQRNLIFRPWDILVYNPDGSLRPNKQLMTETFTDLGFASDNYAHIQIIDTKYEDLLTVVQNYKKRLDANNPDFDYDGVVIKVADQTLRQKIGTEDHRAIRWGIARKWNEDRIGLTILNSVTWQVGRTGNITPVANFKPTYLDGVQVSNATLHNVAFIRKNNLKINAPVKITRSGGVIPYVLGTVSVDEYLLATGMSKVIDISEKNYRDVEIPEVCPVCGHHLEFEGDILKCNNLYCEAQNQRRIENWCSKDVMNLDGIGPRIIEDMLDKGIIACELDLYLVGQNYTAKQIADALGEGYGLTSAKNILSSINESRKRPFECVISGMSIDGIGKQNAKLLAKHFKTMEALKDASLEELKSLDGIGDVLAQNIYDFMQKNGDEWLFLMRDFGLNTEYKEEESAFGPQEKVLAGLHIVFSGKSAYFPGDAVEEYLESLGAKCGHTVNKKVNYLVVGEKPGPAKVSKAKEIGVEMLGEIEFYEKFGLSPEEEI